MDIESLTKTDALNSLDKISSILKCADSNFKYVDHITLIKNYIEDIAKQRQEKRDLELKEIYSETVKEYLLERAKLIKNLKSFIKRNSLSCKEFLNRELEVERSDDLYSLNNLSLMNESISQFYREIDVYNPSFVN